MMEYYAIFGALVTWLIVALAALAAVYITVGRFLLWIYGAFRLRHYAAIDVSWWGTVKYACIRWANFDDEAFYQSHGGKKVYLYGLYKIEDDE